MSSLMHRTRLESHRDSFIGREVPMTGPLLRFAELSSDERSVLAHSLVNNLSAENAPLTPFSYLAVLHSWGIMCPHPMPSRYYDGIYGSVDEIKFDECQWYNCDVCRCIVINR